MVQVFSRWIRWWPGDNRWLWLGVAVAEKSWLAYSLRWFSLSERLFPILLLRQHNGWLLSDVFNCFYLSQYSAQRSVFSTGKFFAEVASVEFLMSSELCLCSLLKRVVIELAGISLSIATALSHNSITANCLTFCHHQLSPCDTGAKTKLSHNTDASS